MVSLGVQDAGASSKYSINSNTDIYFYEYHTFLKIRIIFFQATQKVFMLHLSNSNYFGADIIFYKMLRLVDPR